MSLNTKNNKQVEGTSYEKCRVRVIVKEGNIDKALGTLKRKSKDYGILKEIRDRMEFIKPSAKRRQEIMSAKLRQQKEGGLFEE